MKYFTKEWWADESNESPVEAYWAYIDTIRPCLTRDLVVLLDDVSLHDSQVESFQFVPEQRMATLILQGSSDPWGRSSEPDVARRFTLQYTGVETFSLTDGDGLSLQELDDSDLGYNEVELLPDGTFQHRMLFASDAELHVTFKELKLDFIDERGEPEKQVS